MRGIFSIVPLVLALGGCITPSPIQEASSNGVAGLWEVDSSRNGGVPALTLRFLDDGTITGTVACNSISARYQLVSDTLTISEADITALECGGRPEAARAGEIAQSLLASSPYRVIQREKGRISLMGAAVSWRLKRTDAGM